MRGNLEINLVISMAMGKNIDKAKKIRISDKEIQEKLKNKSV